MCRASYVQIVFSAIVGRSTAQYDVPHGRSILIVEDELVTQRLIAASWSAPGTRLIRVPSVAQAEAAIREVLPD